MPPNTGDGTRPPPPQQGDRTARWATSLGPSLQPPHTTGLGDPAQPLATPEAILEASQAIEREIKLRSSRLEFRKLQEKLALLQREEAALGSTPVGQPLPSQPPPPPPMAQFKLPPLPLHPPPLQPPLPLSPPGLKAPTPIPKGGPHTRDFVIPKIRRAHSLSNTPVGKRARSPPRDSPPAVPTKQPRHESPHTPLVSPSAPQLSSLPPPTVLVEQAKTPTFVITPEELALQHQRYGIEVGVFDLDASAPDTPAPKLEGEALEAMIRQCATGLVSPELQALCLAQQKGRDTSASTTTAVDYGAQALEKLRAQFGEVSTTVCDVMVGSGAWSNPPEKRNASTLPLLTVSSGSTDPAPDPGLPMPAQLGTHLKEVWSRPTVKAPTATKACRMWSNHFTLFCGLVAYPSAEELKIVHTDDRAFRTELRKLGLTDEYERTRNLINKGLLFVRMEANAQALLQFNYSLLQKSVEELLAALEDKDLSSPVRDTLLRVLDGQWGQGQALWALHATSFAAADVAARWIHQSVHELRRMAIKALLGRSCPLAVADELVSLPILPGWLFGPQLVDKFQALASTHTAYQKVSEALRTMGGQGLPSKGGSYKPAAKGPTKQPFLFLPPKGGPVAGNTSFSRPRQQQQQSGRTQASSQAPRPEAQGARPKSRGSSAKRHRDKRSKKGGNGGRRDRGGKGGGQGKGGKGH